MILERLGAQCDDGYYGDKCSSCQSSCVTCVSQYNCSECVAGYYGIWCSESCDTKCVQTECYQHNGTCVHGCPSGYYQADSSCYNCSIQNCEECSDLYHCTRCASGYYQADSRCYKCSIQNCEECSDLYHCTRCASGYNMWSSGDRTYCDVGCPPGTWGHDCHYNCSSNCADTGCDETNGYCDRCTKYTYGVTCQYLCSDGCNDGTTSSSNMCDKQTGQCIYGCKPGYSGTVCDGETVHAVDGQWGQWSEYGPCSVTCGSGSKSRTRSCDNPAPQNGGQPCIGSNVETTDCNLSYCPVDGQWGQWTYTSCSVTCGLGSRSMSRSCDQPEPQNGGLTCNGSDVETAGCNLPSCSGGQWGQWTDYGPCSVTCGWGSRSRTRSCDQPALQNGGHSCNGRDEEATDCHPSSCPDTRSVTAAENDSFVGVAVGGVFGGAVVGFVGALLVGYCIYKKKFWRRGQESGNLDNTYNPTSVAYVNITDTAGSVIVPGNESGVPTYESLDRQEGPDIIYTGLETGNS